MVAHRQRSLRRACIEISPTSEMTFETKSLVVQHTGSHPAPEGNEKRDDLMSQDYRRISIVLSDHGPTGRATSPLAFQQSPTSRWDVYLRQAINTVPKHTLPDLERASPRNL